MPFAETDRRPAASQAEAPDEHDASRHVAKVDPEPKRVLEHTAEDRIGRRKQHREDRCDRQAE